MLSSLFSSKKADPETLFALEWKRPDAIEVAIKKDGDSYFAKVINLDGNVATQAKDGFSLIEMVNEAVYDSLEVPIQYRVKLGCFMPPQDIREEFRLGVPEKYLNSTLSIQKA